MKEPQFMIACKELLPNELSSKKVHIKISKYFYCKFSYKIQNDEVFSSITVSYSIETQPFGCHVKRTYSDILWLHNQLKKHFPRFLVNYNSNISCLH